MRTLATIVAVAAATCVLLAPAVNASTPVPLLPASQHRVPLKGPFLFVVGRTPLVVSGLRFTPGEQIRVGVAQPGGKVWQVARAGRDGRFTTRFAGIRLPACSSASVTALTRRGPVVLKAGAPLCREP